MSREGDKRVCDADDCGRAILWTGYVTNANKQTLEDLYGWSFGKTGLSKDRCKVCTGKRLKGSYPSDLLSDGSMVTCDMCGLVTRVPYEGMGTELTDLGWTEPVEGVWRCNVCSQDDG